MRIELGRSMLRTLPKALLLATVAIVTTASPAFAAEEEGKAANGSEWRTWHAHNRVANKDSLQRGARNFFSYCQGCHSLKYLRYSRMADDLDITGDQLAENLLPPGSKPADYVTARKAADSSMRSAPG